jgi:primosomal protein N' (replication factor Y)
LQTFQPDHYVIQMAAQHDYRGFYKRELDYRRQLGYPPFARLIRLEFRGRDEHQVEQTAQNLADQILGWIDQSGQHATEMMGPLPCFFARMSGEYRWQIVLRGPNPTTVLRGKELKEARVEVDPPSLL